MTRGTGSGRTRVKTARGRTTQSTRWLERQLNDPYVRRAKAEGYRSRAAYKLLELDERFGLLGGVRRVIDLGIAPGGWSQVVRRRTPAAVIVGIDLLPVDPLDGVTIIAGDFMDDAAPDRLIAALGGAPDLVLSDMAANTVGHPQTDALRTMALVEAAHAFAIDVLRPGGAFVAKVFAGGADATFVAEMKRHFATVKHAKPPASRKGSVEWFVVAQGFKGRRDAGNVAGNGEADMAVDGDKEHPMIDPAPPHPDPLVSQQGNPLGTEGHYSGQEPGSFDNPTPGRVDAGAIHGGRAAAPAAPDDPATPPEAGQRATIDPATGAVHGAGSGAGGGMAGEDPDGDEHGGDRA